MTKGRTFVKRKPDTITFPPEAVEQAKQSYYKRVQHAEYERKGLQSNWRPKRPKAGGTDGTGQG